MRPSNTRPQHHAADGPPIRPHARSDRPSAVEHPTYARHPSVRLDSCLRRNDGGERRNAEGSAGMTEGPRPERSSARCNPQTQRSSSPHSACEIASPTNPGQARSRINRDHPIAALRLDPAHDLLKRPQHVETQQLQLVPAPGPLSAARPSSAHPTPDQSQSAAVASAFSSLIPAPLPSVIPASPSSVIPA